MEFSKIRCPKEFNNILWNFSDLMLREGSEISHDFKNVCTSLGRDNLNNLLDKSKMFVFLYKYVELKDAIQNKARPKFQKICKEIFEKKSVAVPLSYKLLITKEVCDITLEEGMELTDDTVREMISDWAKLETSV
jgi:hypothetical protein